MWTRSPKLAFLASKYMSSWQTRLKHKPPYDQIQCSLLPPSLSRPIPGPVLGTIFHQGGRNKPDVHPNSYGDLHNTGAYTEHV